MKRKKIAAANWKMNTDVPEGIQLFKNLNSKALSSEVEVVVCAPYTHLYALEQLASGSTIRIGAQNVHEKMSGAYTGEVAAEMIRSLGVSHVIIGHSERRMYYGEGNDMLAQKLRMSLDSGLVPIFCCGESLEIRKAGNHISYVLDQLDESLRFFSAEDLGVVIIAYEPVWAIGTGETATPGQAQEMQAAIRGYIKEKFGANLAQNIPILYGGSVKPDNAKEIFGQEDVDGGLVGGASLDADAFAQIVNSFS
jgi:triosephosphate isomerase